MKSLDQILEDLNEMADPEYVSRMEYFDIKGATSFETSLTSKSLLSGLLLESKSEIRLNGIIEIIVTLLYSTTTRSVHESLVQPIHIERHT